MEKSGEIVPFYHLPFTICHNLPSRMRFSASC
jgi:hypothetical protein